MQPMVRYLNGALAFAADLAATLPDFVRVHPTVYCRNSALGFLSGVVVGLAGRLDRLWHSLVREQRAPAPPVAVAAPAPRLGTAREWEIVVGVLARDLARVSAVAAIQSRAALKIDAAEHALGRIIADCAKTLAAPLMPARRPAGRLARRHELRIRRQLAA